MILTNLLDGRKEVKWRNMIFNPQLREISSPIEDAARKHQSILTFGNSRNFDGQFPKLARCGYCGYVSDPRKGMMTKDGKHKIYSELPFFQRTDCQYDTYYCGCRGWD